MRCGACDAVGRHFEVGLRVCDIVVNKYVRYLISWWVLVNRRRGPPYPQSWVALPSWASLCDLSPFGIFWAWKICLCWKWCWLTFRHYNSSRSYYNNTDSSCIRVFICMCSNFDCMSYVLLLISNIVLCYNINKPTYLPVVHSSRVNSSSTVTAKIYWHWLKCTSARFNRTHTGRTY